MRRPRLLDDVVEEWTLVLDGDVLDRRASVVVPVRTRDGAAAVLKISSPSPENEHEHLALQRWGGDGAVRLLRADPHRRALLLERASTTDLTSLGYLEAAEVAAAAYARLHVPALPQLRTITAYVGRSTDALAALPRDAPIPRRLVEQALSHARDLATGPATGPASTGRLVHGDLHDHHLLRSHPGESDSWLAIDPQPMSGDPHWEPAALLWSRWDEVVARGRIRADVHERFLTVVDAAGLDEDRARAWVVLRLVLGAYSSIEEAARQDRPLTGDESDWITRCITIMKAVDPS
ncbi:aminoglycoside phosphotransferase family protein [Nocardioides bigeumensis]|uniref:Streptomycin 6-kinase n=1 Tax=Nocardioides bigeumensis TaxID=433657 RepID=A0ABN2Y852_9ACTN